MPMRKGKQKDLEFQISHFYCPFSSDILAVKGLRKKEKKIKGFQSPWLCIGRATYRSHQKRILIFLLKPKSGKSYLRTLVFRTDNVSAVLMGTVCT